MHMQHDAQHPPPPQEGLAAVQAALRELVHVAHPLVFASDLDRTLTGPDLVPDEQALAAVRRLRAAGVRCILVTGRPQADIAAHPHLPAAFDAYVLEGGALYGPWGDFVVAGNGPVALAAADRLEAAGVRVQRRQASCNCKADAHEQVFALAADCSIQRNADEYDILPPGHDKGTGLDGVLARLALRSARVVAVGDGDNDIPFFDRTDLGVAVGNAGPLLRQAADATLSAPGPQAVQELAQALLDALAAATPAPAAASSAPPGLPGTAAIAPEPAASPAAAPARDAGAGAQAQPGQPPEP